MTWDFKAQTKVFWFVDKNNVLIIIKKTNLLTTQGFFAVKSKRTVLCDLNSRGIQTFEQEFVSLSEVNQTKRSPCFPHQQCTATHDLNR